MRDLKKWIKEELPSNGEWWKDGYEAFINAAEIMMNAGIKKRLIKDILQNLHDAVCDEYGD